LPSCSTILAKTPFSFTCCDSCIFFQKLKQVHHEAHKYIFSLPFSSEPLLESMQPGSENICACACVRVCVYNELSRKPQKKGSSLEYWANHACLHKNSHSRLLCPIPHVLIMKPRDIKKGLVFMQGVWIQSISMINVSTGTCTYRCTMDTVCFENLYIWDSYYHAVQTTLAKTQLSFPRSRRLSVL